MGLARGRSRSLRDGGAVAFNPVSALFGAGEPGAFWPFTLGTLWKDVARTDPVTTAGDLIAVADDISGNGNHLVQPTSSQRFTWQTDGTYQWAAPDGINDFMSVNINMSSTNAVTIFNGVQKLSATVQGIILEHTINTNSQPGSFFIIAPIGTSTDSGFSIRGTTNLSRASGGISTTGKRVITSMGDTVNGNPQILRSNGVLIDTNTDVRGGGQLANAATYVGMRAGSSLPFQGLIFPQIIRGSLTTPELITSTENWVNSKTGAY